MHSIKYGEIRNFFRTDKKENKKNHKNGEEVIKTISYELKVIVSARFMVSSLSNLVDNLTEAIHKIK